MDEYLDPVLSTRRTSNEPARGLLNLTREQQDFALHWTNVIRRSNAEMAFQFISRAPKALKLLGLEGSKQWLLGAMDVYDKQGLYPGSAAFDKLEEFAAEHRLSHISVSLDEIKNILETFICGLAGRSLRIESATKTFTDTETLYLPERINRFNDREQNYKYYKILATHLWAQTWFGTFKRESAGSPYLSDLIADFDDSGRALKLFNLLETIRLNACITRELPGLAREMLTLHTSTPIHDATWNVVTDRLESKVATVKDTLQGVIDLYNLQSPWPDPLIYQGEFEFSATEKTIEQRLSSEKSNLQDLIADLLKGKNNASDGEMNDLELNQNNEEGDSPEITLDGESLTLPSELSNLLSSLFQDLEELPEDWLEPSQGNESAGDSSNNQNSDNDRKGLYSEEGALIYDEWDYRRQTYRKNWCVVRELSTHPSYDNFVPSTLEKYSHLVSEIRRHFEALRGEDKILKAQQNGDGIDLDALFFPFKRSAIRSCKLDFSEDNLCSMVFSVALNSNSPWYISGSGQGDCKL